MIKISKSDYVLNLKCPNAIWFKKFRKDLQQELNTAEQTRFMMQNLHDYCGQAPMAMVQLLNVVQEKTSY